MRDCNQNNASRGLVTSHLRVFIACAKHWYQVILIITATQLLIVGYVVKPQPAM